VKKLPLGADTKNSESTTNAAFVTSVMCSSLELDQRVAPVPSSNHGDVPFQGFQTGLGRGIYVSEESLQKAQLLLTDEEQQ